MPKYPKITLNIKISQIKKTKWTQSIFLACLKESNTVIELFSRR